MDRWTLQELSYKVDSEGGWWDFFMWGGLNQGTGNVEVDQALAHLRSLFEAAERVVNRLDGLLPDPSEVDDDDE